MSFRILICWLFLLTPLAHGQVNIEKLRSEHHEDGFSGSLGLKTAFTQGNIDFADFGMTGHIEWKKGAHLFFWVTNGRFAAKRTQSDYAAEPDISLWDKEAHFSNSLLEHMRYNYTLADALWWEAYTQFEFNEFLLLDRRVLLGTGPRVALAQGDDGGLWMGTAAMVESERLNPESIAASEAVDAVNLRWSNYITGTWKPSDTTAWITTVYIQPRIDAFDDYRFSAETGLLFSITEHMKFTLDAKLRQDSTPPETAPEVAAIQSQDIRLGNSLKFTW